MTDPSIGADTPPPTPPHKGASLNVIDEKYFLNSSHYISQ
jgi:hypothetical protein